MGFQSDKRLYVNADKSKVVEEDSPEAAYLLVGQGGTVTDEDAKKYNLKAPKKTEVTEVPVEAEADTEEAEAKQEPAPANKAESMPKDKK
jgi:hypothetical protein